MDRCKIDTFNIGRKSHLKKFKLIKTMIDDWAEWFVLDKDCRITLRYEPGLQNGEMAYDPTLSQYMRHIILISDSALKIQDPRELECMVIHEMCHIFLQMYTGTVMGLVGNDYQEVVGNLEETIVTKLSYMLTRLAIDEKYNPDFGFEDELD